MQTIYVRRGTDAERQTIILEDSELGWTTDTHMLYIGDGVTSGGLLVTASGLGIISLEGLMGIVTMSGQSGVAVHVVGQEIRVSGTIIEYVQSLNELSDEVVLSGIGSVDVTTSGQQIVVSGIVYPENLIELNDAPTTYSGKANQLVSVNDGESGVEFVKVFKIQNSLDNNDYSGLTTDGIAGETLEFGDSVVLASDSKWGKTDATVENQTDGHVGLVIASGVLDDTIQLLLNGYLRDDTWSFNVGDSIYIGYSGALTNVEPTTSGEFVRIIGHARTASVIWYSPDNTFIKLKI